MLQYLLAGLCGFVGALFAIYIAYKMMVYNLTRAMPAYFNNDADDDDDDEADDDDDDGEEEDDDECYNDVEVLDYSIRPQGVYIRFRNTGTKTLDGAEFSVRGYKKNQLWFEHEEDVVCVVKPGQEKEVIVKIKDSHSKAKSIDLANCRVEVRFLRGYVV